MTMAMVLVMLMMMTMFVLADDSVERIPVSGAEGSVQVAVQECTFRPHCRMPLKPETRDFSTQFLNPQS